MYNLLKNPGAATGEMECALQRLGCTPSVPAVFIGGKFVGSAEEVISSCQWVFETDAH